MYLQRLRDALAAHFDVERELGVGGMGIVFLGRDRGLDRPVAIKVLRPEAATAEAAERFLREARVLASLSHPNIVPIHQVGEAGGFFYYVMDFLPGATLAARLRNGPLPPQDTIRICRDLVDALDAAHRSGVVHRDVKPSNIVLNESGRAILMDFGVAKSTGFHEPITVPGQLIGTPDYMAPEQLSGGAVTPRTDLYALGLVLYETVTGRAWPPLADPDTADWTGVPAALVLVLRRALALDAGARWPDAATLRAALAERRPRRARTWLIAAGVAAAALAIYLLTRPAAGRPDFAVEPFQVAQGSDPSLGMDLAVCVAQQLQAFRRWRVPAVEPATVELRAAARNRATGTLIPSRDSLVLLLTISDRRGTVVASERVAGRRGDLCTFGALVAVRSFQALRPDLLPPTRVPRPPATIAALGDWLAGDDAFRDGRWREAEAHFSAAVGADSGFLPAQWQLWNVQRWRRASRSIDLQRLLAQGEQLGAVDRLLITAELAPAGPARHAAYEAALAREPENDYAALLYASELFHRGPLFGIGLDSSVALLQRVTRRSPGLQPAHDQLIWALVRTGDRKAAERALTRLDSVAGKGSRDQPPELLHLAAAVRFAPEEALAQLRAPAADMAALLFERARFPLALDAPEAELALGTALAAPPEPLHGREANGRLAQGLALVALGRPGAAVAAFDAAADLQGTQAARILAAQWRVLPAALGLPGPREEEVRHGRAALQRAVQDPATAMAAAWTLALDGFARHDQEAPRWRARARAAGVDTLTLQPLLAAVELAASGRPADALAITQPLLSYVERNHQRDPFARAALFLLRANWLDALGRHAAADTARRWEQSTDFDGWLTGAVQPAEVDWSLGVYARWRRGVDALARGDHTGCPLLRRVLELWREPEPSVEPLVRQAQQAVGACP